MASDPSYETVKATANRRDDPASSHIKFVAGLDHRLPVQPSVSWRNHDPCPPCRARKTKCAYIAINSPSSKLCRTCACKGLEQCPSTSDINISSNSDNVPSTDGRKAYSEASTQTDIRSYQLDYLNVGTNVLANFEERTAFCSEPYHQLGYLHQSQSKESSDECSRPTLQYYADQAPTNSNLAVANQFMFSSSYDMRSSFEPQTQFMPGDLYAYAPSLYSEGGLHMNTGYFEEYYYTTR